MKGARPNALPRRLLVPQVLAVRMSPADGCGVFPGVHVFGHDVADHNLAGTALSEQPRHCAELCEARAECTHWMLVPGDYSGHPAPALLPLPLVAALRGTCSLQTLGARGVPHDGLLSGARGCVAHEACAERDREYWGGLYRQQRTPTAGVCQQLCRANAHCAYWTFVPLDYAAPLPGRLARVPEAAVAFLAGRCFLKYPPTTWHTMPAAVSLFPGALAGHRRRLCPASWGPAPALEAVWPLWRLPAASWPAAGAQRQWLVQGAALLLRPHADLAQRAALLDERLCLPAAAWPLRLRLLPAPLAGRAPRPRLRALLLERLGLVQGGLLARVLQRTPELRCPAAPGACALDVSSLKAAATAACLGWQIADAPAPIAFSRHEDGQALPVWWARGELLAGEARLFLERELRTYSMQLLYGA